MAAKSFVMNEIKLDRITLRGWFRNSKFPKKFESKQTQEFNFYKQNCVQNQKHAHL